VTYQAVGETARRYRTLHSDPSDHASGRRSMDSRDQARRLPADCPQAGRPGASFHTQASTGPARPWRACRRHPRRSTARRCGATDRAWRSPTGSTAAPTTARCPSMLSTCSSWTAKTGDRGRSRGASRVGFPPGGAVDIGARMIGHYLTVSGIGSGTAVPAKSQRWRLAWDDRPRHVAAIPDHVEARPLYHVAETSGLASVSGLVRGHVQCRRWANPKAPSSAFFPCACSKLAEHNLRSGGPTSLPPSWPFVWRRASWRAIHGLPGRMQRAT
jgi:hypothetical protein